MRLMLAALLACATLAAQPRRIISTGPSITEILFALGLGDRVVGVTQYCNYPPEAQKVRRIGTWTTPNLEAILELKPDLVLVQKTAVHDSARFNALKLATLEVHLDSLATVYAAIRSIAGAAGVQDRGDKLVGSLQSQLTAVRKSVEGRPLTRFLFIVGRNPGTLEGLIAVGKGSFLDELFAAAGGVNILNDSPLMYPKVLHEEVLSRNPEVIIDMGEHPDASGLTEAQVRKEVALWGRFRTIAAVRNKRIHIVASDLYVHSGPRIGALAAQLAKMLHPETAR